MSSNADTSSKPIGLTHPPLRVAVLDTLREQIVSGRYLPGDRLLEEEVAAELEVSRNPVREALQALAVEGFVDIEPRRGARVTTITPKRAHELFELRLPLEALVADLAAQRRSPDQMAELQSLVERGLAATKSGDLQGLPDMNRRFHALLAEAADNQLLADTLMRLAHVIQWVYASRIRTRSSASWAEHALIVEAIERQDGTAASRLAHDHVQQARDAYLAADPVDTTAAGS